jgi:hypothetical protein
MDGTQVFVLEMLPVGAKVAKEKLTPSNAFLLVKKRFKSDAWKLVDWEWSVIEPAADVDNEQCG